MHQNADGSFDTPAEGATPAGLHSALAAQALFPVTSRVEMRGETGDTDINGVTNELAAIADDDLPAQWSALMDRLRAVPGYVSLFAAAYPDVPSADLGIEHAVNAIAAFETEKFSSFNSPFDAYLRGDDNALTDQQKQGALLFYGGARCAQCHRGTLLSDFAFHNIAMPQVGPGVGTDAPLDLGRFNETANPADRFRFRTPILRNVALTGPWTHSGAYTSLHAVVAHYRNPAAALRNYDPGQLRGDLQSQVSVQQQLDAGILNNLDPRLVPPPQLNNQDVADIVAFLNSLTDPNVRALAGSRPATVPSGLPVTD